MKQKDWEIKVILQKDNQFIEHVLNSNNDVDEEDRMIRMIDGIDQNEVEWERKGLLLEEAKSIIEKLDNESQRVLLSYINTPKYESMAKVLGCSISTAWKKWQKVQKEIEEIKNARE